MATKQHPYRSKALRSLHLAMEGLHKVGAIDRKTMREFDVECLTTIETFDADGIRALREKAQMSQAVFARVLNVSTSVVSKWEQGEKRPSGPSLKLLSLAYRKGVEAIM
ncbi:helix-turn-helix domain-containing protein [Jiella sonneratiae]|uniref:DNA-binding transcriptional regulator n=1 Tax=Jiella sonneratiae TaxID=2816856 RepID=A0ABS3J7Z4_9HYPH|nr:DNA-binding transcriptional regulator [Jiella sonneratiae]MBO0905260.1 DNA-binding transcriptional regulator [Jiella sonneratiae]